MDINHFNNLDFYDSLVWNQEYFGVSKIFNIPDGGNAYVMIETGSKYVHGTLAFQSMQASIVEIYAGPTATTGTPVSSNNFFLASTNTPLTVLSLAPSVSAQGTKITEYIIPAGGKGSVGAATAIPRHFVLPPLSKFLLKFVDISEGAVGLLHAQIQFNFYETEGPIFSRSE